MYVSPDLDVGNDLAVVWNPCHPNGDPKGTAVINTFLSSLLVLYIVPSLSHILNELQVVYLHDFACLHEGFSHSFCSRKSKGPKRKCILLSNS